MINDVVEKNNNFDFEDFFFSSGDENFSAIRIITKNQTITCLTEAHEDYAEKIMRALYPEFNESFEDNAYWPDIVGSYGNISIQMLKKGFEIINIPKEINSYQFNELFNFYKDMMVINREFRKNGIEEIELYTNIFHKNHHLNLAKALIYLKDKVVDNDLNNEEVIIPSNKVK